MRRSLLCAVLGALLALQAWSPAERGRGAPVPPITNPRAEPADHESYTETLPGTRVSFRMMAVPGGTFWMGSSTPEKGRRDHEGPPHLVRVGPLWMGRCEVTWNEYELFMNSTAETKATRRPVDDGKGVDAIHTRPSPAYIDETWGFGRVGYPVVGITHHAAMEYCRWLSRRTGKNYRLPTEAEWEFACRSGARTAYCFGDDPATLAEYAWYAKNSEDRTHPVGQKKPNPWGLCDMYGNVAEWCLDHYDKDAYRHFTADVPALRPVLRPTERRFPHVVRGGCWADDVAACRSAARRGSDPSWLKSDPMRPKSIWWLSNCDYAGFRIVRAVAEQDDLKGLRSKVTPKSQ